MQPHRRVVRQDPAGGVPAGQEHAALGQRHRGAGEVEQAHQPAGTGLSLPEGWGPLTAEAQEGDPGSVLSLYRAALERRRTSPAFAGEGLDWVPAPGGCLAFRRPGGLVCLLNLSGAPVPLPEGRVLLASAEVDGGALPDDAAVWLQA